MSTNISIIKDDSHIELVVIKAIYIYILCMLAEEVQVVQRVIRVIRATRVITAISSLGHTC